MKRLRILTLILLILSVGAFFATNALRRLRADSTLPQISCGDDVLYLSVEDGRDAMLQGMNAWDGKDGDLTGDIVVERVSGGEEKGQLTVSYAVADSDRHVAGYTRTVVYTDYRSPQFYLSKPLRYGVGEDIQVRDRLGALDQIDGTISASRSAPTASRPTTPDCIPSRSRSRIPSETPPRSRSISRSMTASSVSRSSSSTGIWSISTLRRASTRIRISAPSRALPRAASAFPHLRADCARASTASPIPAPERTA